MRGLTAKQKKLLDEWYNKNKDKIQQGRVFFKWDKCKYFSLELYEQLEQINDTEILSQSINNYIQEKE